jgi:hypothetical protein
MKALPSTSTDTVAVAAIEKEDKADASSGMWLFHVFLQLEKCFPILILDLSYTSMWLWWELVPYGY